MPILNSIPAEAAMKKIIALILSLTLTGCASYKTLEPVNGSKADGTVTLSYQYDWLEDPQVDWNLANDTAQHRCSAWGYKSAEKFSGSHSRCLERSESGACLQTQIDVVYQCTN